MFQLPQLDESGLNQLAICAHADLTDQDAGLAEWLSANAGRKYAKLPGIEAFGRRIIDVSSDKKVSHFHLEVLLKTRLAAEPQQLSSFEEVFADVPTTLAAKSFTVTTIGAIRIATSELPSKSIAATLLGVSAPVGGSQLRLRGFALDVINGAPFTDIECTVGRNSTIIVEIIATYEKSINGNWLIDGASLIQRGNETFVLGKSQAKGAAT